MECNSRAKLSRRRLRSPVLEMAFDARSRAPRRPPCVITSVVGTALMKYRSLAGFDVAKTVKDSLPVVIIVDWRKPCRHRQHPGTGIPTHRKTFLGSIG